MFEKTNWLIALIFIAISALILIPTCVNAQEAYEESGGEEMAVEETGGETAADSEEEGGDQYEVAEIKEVIAARGNYEYMKSLLIMMVENKSPEEIERVIFEIERYTEIADDLLKVVEIFYEGTPQMEAMARIVAKTHMLMAVFYEKAKDYAGTIDHIKIAEEIYPMLYEDMDMEIEHQADFNSKKNRNVIRYAMKDPVTLKSDLESTIGTSKTIQVEIKDFELGTLSGVRIKSLIDLPRESVAAKLLEIANKTLEKALLEGQTNFFRVTLASGSYELQQDEGLVFPQRFDIHEASDNVLLLVQPDEWFTLKFEKNYRRMPVLTYNGIEIINYSKLAYGEYQLETDPDLFENPPTKLIFVKEGENIDTSEFRQIVVPLKGSHILHLSERGFGKKMVDKKPKRRRR